MPWRLPNRVSDGLNHVLDFFLPRFCLLCQHPLPPGAPGLACAACHATIPYLSHPRCLCCGAPFRSRQGGARLCHNCLRQPPPFDRALAAAFYEGPVLDAIHRLKYHRDLLYGKLLGEIMHRAFDLTEAVAAAQLLLPVPLHPQRLRWRGFNQAILLAQNFPDIPLARDVLVRERPTLPQVGLSSKERLANVKGAFRVRQPELVAGKNVIILDDVFTTGATVSECARVLRRAGAAHIEVITVARVGYA
ncbi:MAG: ComF family protein [Desulfobacca sp.]|uniref:ComF family protein n=1 Tax=Desulfobacca sp. TaxID=2067990 RepID=UPI00404995C4